MSPRLAVPTEHEEQCRLMELARLHEGRHPELALLFAVPNGGFRSKRTAGRMRMEGIKPGVPDLFLPVPRAERPGAAGLWIELKRLNAPPSCVSPVQAEWHARLRQQGYRVEVCRGHADAWAVLCQYLSIPNTLEASHAAA